MAHPHGRGAGALARVLGHAVSHPLPRVRPIDVGIVARHDDLLLQSGEIGQVHQLGFLAGRVAVAMTVAGLTVAPGRGEDAVDVMGGGAGRRLRTVAGVGEGLALVVAPGRGLRLGTRDVATRRSRVAGKLGHVWHGWHGCLERGLRWGNGATEQRSDRAMERWSNETRQGGKSGSRSISQSGRRQSRIEDDDLSRICAANLEQGRSRHVVVSLLLGSPCQGSCSNKGLGYPSEGWQQEKQTPDAARECRPFFALFFCRGCETSGHALRQLSQARSE